MQRDPRSDRLRDPDAFDPSLIETPAERLARRWRQRDRSRRYLSPAQRVVLLGGGPFSPRNISGLQIWLDAPLAAQWQNTPGTTAATADADPVRESDDKSNNARDGIAPSDAARPTLQLNEINGLQVLRFDGTNDELDSTDFDPASGLYIAIVARLNVGATDFVGLVDKWDASAGYMIDLSSGANRGKPRLSIGSQTALLADTVVSTTAAFIVEAWSDGTTGYIYLNGSQVATAALTLTGIGTTQVLKIPCDYASTVGVATTDVGAVLIYDPVPPESDRTKIRAYLRQRFGTP